MKKLKELIDIIKDEEYVYIQTHNFPDNDSVASAFGLQYLFEAKGIKSFIVYDGAIQRDSLIRLIDKLEIPIKHVNEYSMTSKDKIIIVDGCKGNKNVTDLIGDEIGVIDHHETKSPDDVRFNDIRSEYGACSTLIFNYFNEFGLTVPVNIATALLTGILVDTAQMTRGVDREDVTAYSMLYGIANINFVNAILRNYIQKKDLSFYKKAIEKVNILDRFAFCYFEEGCNQNLLGIIGDFFLALNEVDFVFLCARNKNNINFSIRSEVDKWNSAFIIQEVLKGKGFGGGHSDMAGGIIKDLSLFNEKEMFNKLVQILNS